MTTKQAVDSVEEIFSLYEQWGQEDYIGEPVSQLEHMVQAAQLAEAEGYDDEVILAAFFHDIGHLAEHLMPVEKMENAGVVNHEKIGADYLRKHGFSALICDLVQHHVEAKRYLIFKYPGYLNQLSPASKTTLLYQGGVMTAKEAADFEADLLHSLYIKMREWDDMAKEENKPLPSLEHYRKKAIDHLSSATFIFP